MADDRIRRAGARSHYFPNGTPFEVRIDKSGGPDACWPWMAARTTHGYGSFHKDGTRRLAHREAYELENGVLPDGTQVLHSCDNPPCCNPAHLFLGTYRDNVHDMKAKGRIAHSERHGQVIYSDQTVREALALYRAGGISKRGVAREFGMSAAHFRRITNGQVRTVTSGL